MPSLPDDSTLAPTDSSSPAPTLYTVLDAAAQLGWSPARLRYWEARFRNELGCVRQSDGDPLFTFRQIRLLQEASHWLAEEDESEEVVRRRLQALQSYAGSIASIPHVAPATKPGPAATGTETEPVEVMMDTEQAGTRTDLVAPAAAAAATHPSVGAAETDPNWVEIHRHLDTISRGIESLREDIGNLEELLGQLLTLLEETHVVPAFPSFTHQPESGALGTSPTLPPTKDLHDDSDISASPATPRIYKRRELSAWSLPRWQPPQLPGDLTPAGPTSAQESLSSLGVPTMAGFAEAPAKQQEYGPSAPPTLPATFDARNTDSGGQ
ncbi:MAG: MerR family transcriptional regulator [Limnochordaceae bacterium]|nr:MerR family transcriptional regulator [Limnochordaceae bacterium]